MANTLKVLVCGDVEGKFDQLYKRVSSVQSKAGAFDILFCVGDFFGTDNSQWAAYCKGEKKAPIPTFILGPSKDWHSDFFKDENGCELCENITYLEYQTELGKCVAIHTVAGKKGLYTGSSGLYVAYMSGTEGTSSDSTHFTNSDIDALRMPLVSNSKFQGVDILLTSQWPKAVEKYGVPAEDNVDSSKTGSGLLAQLALSLKPRYHIAACEGTFYERQPYRNHKVLQEGARHVTRFIGMAKVGNPLKKKFLYAFNITPLKQLDVVELTKQPPGVTECPYKVDTESMLRQQVEEDKPSQFFWSQGAVDGKDQGQKRKSQGQHDQQDRKKPAQPSGPCWFCLGSPEVEKHLIVSVGMQTYLALAKGGIVDDHVLICPIGHHQSIVSAPSDVVEELDKYKKALKKYFKKQKKAVVFFERNYKTQHLQIQAVPIPVEKANLTKETFEKNAEEQKFNLDEIPPMSDLKQIVPERAPYFYVELPTGEKLFRRIAKGFPLQFGREVMCDDELLSMPERVDWRNCSITKETETQLANNFREAFQPFDFTLED